MSDIAIYVHVPFCRHICYYCDFCHFVYSRSSVKNWLEAFKREVALHKDKKAKTIYIGGGTPTALDADILEAFLEILTVFGKPIEYTIEINPETFDSTKAELLKRYGVNRASIGYISSNDEELVSLGRRHSMTDTEMTVSYLKEVGIDNYSLDVLYSFPKQTFYSFKKTLDDALKLEPKHISLYSLTIEEETPFYRDGVKPFDEDTEAEYYEYTKNLLEEKGFNQYEVSNFALSGYESKHNLVYWHYEDFLGLSMGATSKMGMSRYQNASVLSAYLKGDFTSETVKLTKEDAMFEMVMMNLRLKEGLDLKRFKDVFGEDIKEVYKEKLPSLLANGSLVLRDNHIVCTNLEILNTILVELL